MFGKRKWSDDELVKAIKSGDQQALVQLYEANYGSVRNLVLKNNGGGEDVEDVLQEAVITFWQNAGKTDFQLTAKISTYIYAIAKNVWLKSLNKGKRLEPMQEHHENRAVASDNYSGIDNKLVRNYLNQLGDTCRTLLMLFYFDGLDMTAIAERLNFANADTAKAKKYQCFKRLESLVKSHHHKSDFLN